MQNAARLPRVMVSSFTKAMRHERRVEGRRSHERYLATSFLRTISPARDEQEPRVKGAKSLNNSSHQAGRAQRSPAVYDRRHHLEDSRKGNGIETAQGRRSFASSSAREQTAQSRPPTLLCTARGREAQARQRGDDVSRFPGRVAVSLRHLSTYVIVKRVSHTGVIRARYAHTRVQRAPSSSPSLSPLLAGERARSCHK
jgi:hypothetical protein